MAHYGVVRSLYTDTSQSPGEVEAIMLVLYIDESGTPPLVEGAEVRFMLDLTGPDVNQQLIDAVRDYALQQFSITVGTDMCFVPQLIVG